MKKHKLPSTALSSALALLLGFGMMCVHFQAKAAQDSIEVSIKIPVIGVNITPGLIMTGPSVQGIEIQVAGSAERMQALQDTRLKYELDLSGLGNGIHTIPITREQITLPEGLSTVKLNTQTITIRIDTEIKKELPVNVFVEGDAAPGFHVTGASASPNKALLSGPQYILDDIEHITTNPIDIAGASESFKKEITLNLAESVTVLFPADPIITQIDIAEKTIVRTLKDLKLTGRNIKLPNSITPPAISLDVKGPANIVNTLETNEAFTVFLDLKGLKPGVYVRRATIVLPVPTMLVGVSPEIFTVTIKGK
ncbi:MAG: CdaR family protein [Thermodesulfobacteriota bacterium]